MNIIIDKNTGNVGIGIIAPSHQIEIQCGKCDNNSFIDTNFGINIILMQFKCNKCGDIIMVPDNTLLK